VNTQENENAVSEEAWEDFLFKGGEWKEPGDLTLRELKQIKKICVKQTFAKIRSNTMLIAEKFNTSPNTSFELMKSTTYKNYPLCIPNKKFKPGKYKGKELK